MLARILKSFFRWHLYALPPSVIFTGAPPPFAAQPLPTHRVRVTLLAAADVWKAYAVVPVKGGKQHR